MSRFKIGDWVRLIDGKLYKIIDVDDTSLLCEYMEKITIGKTNTFIEPAVPKTVNELKQTIIRPLSLCGVKLSQLPKNIEVWRVS